MCPDVLKITHWTTGCISPKTQSSFGISDSSRSGMVWQVRSCSVRQLLIDSAFGGRQRPGREVPAGPSLIDAALPPGRPALVRAVRDFCNCLNFLGLCRTQLLAGRITGVVPSVVLPEFTMRLTIVLIAIVLVSTGCSDRAPEESPVPTPTLALPAPTIDPLALSPARVEEWAGQFFDCVQGDDDIGGGFREEWSPGLSLAMSDLI